MPYVDGMGKQETVALSLDAEQLADLDRLASDLGCSREDLIQTAIHRMVDEQDARPPYARLGFDSQAELDAFLEPALDDIAADRTCSREQADTVFDKLIAGHRARAR